MVVLGTPSLCSVRVSGAIEHERVHWTGYRILSIFGSVFDFPVSFLR